MEKENEVENVTIVKEKEMSYMKQNYEKKISTLENQLKDKVLKIESLTEERINIDKIHQENIQKTITEKDEERLKFNGALETKINTLEDQVRKADNENQTPSEEKDQLNRLIEKIEKEAEFKQKEALTEQLTVQQEEMNKLFAGAKYGEFEKVMAEKNKEMEKMKKAADEKIRKLEVELTRAFKMIKLDLISSFDVHIPVIHGMTVMRETRLIVVSTAYGTLHQLSLQEGSVITQVIQKQIEPPCRHSVPVYLLCKQVAGREYLALSCYQCTDIKLMNQKRKKGILRQFGSGSSIQYEGITAFSGEKVQHMCHGEENRLFVESLFDVLELDTSSTTFIKMRTINSGMSCGLCYVPDPHRLLVVRYEKELYAVTCDDNTLVWRVKKEDDLDPYRLLYVSGHNAILVADWKKNRVVVLNSATGLQVQSITLPRYVHEIQGMCLFNDQIIVGSNGDDGRISYFSPKRIVMK